jgi:hypothetical protein
MTGDLLPGEQITPVLSARSKLAAHLYPEKFKQHVMEPSIDLESIRKDIGSEGHDLLVDRLLYWLKENDAELGDMRGPDGKMVSAEVGLKAAGIETYDQVIAGYADDPAVQEALVDALQRAEADVQDWASTPTSREITEVSSYDPLGEAKEWYSKLSDGDRQDMLLSEFKGLTEAYLESEMPALKAFKQMMAMEGPGLDPDRHVLYADSEKLATDLKNVTDDIDVLRFSLQTLHDRRRPANMNEMLMRSFNCMEAWANKVKTSRSLGETIGMDFRKNFINALEGVPEVGKQVQANRPPAGIENAPFLQRMKSKLTTKSDPYSGEDPTGTAGACCRRSGVHGGEPGRDAVSASGLPHDEGCARFLLQAGYGVGEDEDQLPRDGHLLPGFRGLPRLPHHAGHVPSGFLLGED